MTSPNVVAELPLHVDSTMLSAFRSCPRKFYHEFVLGLRPTAMSVDLHAGACFASALEYVYELCHQHGIDTQTALVRTYGLFLKQWGDFEPMKDTPKTRERVWEAVEDYVRTYAPATDHVQPAKLEGHSGYEFSFGIPLIGDEWPQHPSGSPFIYSGRFDMLGSWNGKLVVRDEKTTTSIGAAWADQWDLRSQFMGYVWACQQSGLDVDTVVVRGVGILKTKISQVEAIKQIPRFMVDRWLEQTKRSLWNLRRMWDEQHFDYNLADACTSYGGCAFRTICGSPSPERWYGNYVVKRWNPLAKQPIDPEFAA
jgi:hypothetical protein